MAVSDIRVVGGMATPTAVLCEVRSCPLEPFAPGPHTLSGYSPG
jgi:hypothetical protein